MHISTCGIRRVCHFSQNARVFIWPNLVQKGTSYYIKFYENFQISIPRSWELALEYLQLKTESPDNRTVTFIVKKKQCPTRGSSNQVCIMYGLHLTKSLCSPSVLDHIKTTEFFTDSATIGIKGPMTCLLVLCKT